MRILVVSDTHGNEYALRQAIEEQPKARMVIHLGDGIKEAEDTASEYSDREFKIVRGNCDWGRSDIPEVESVIAGGKRLLFTHGHRYDVKMGFYRVVCEARDQKADILLFGHTHVPYTDYDDGLYIMNPGSLSHGRPTYGFIDITDAGIVTQIRELRA